RSLHDGDRAGVADAEALAHAPGDEEPAARRAVRDGVAGEDRVVRAIDVERPDGDDPAAHALAHVVLGLAFERQLDARVEEAAEALARAADVRAPIVLHQRRAHGARGVVDAAVRRRRGRRVAIALD